MKLKGEILNKVYEGEGETRRKAELNICRAFIEDRKLEGMPPTRLLGFLTNVRTVKSSETITQLTELLKEKA